LPRWIPDNKVVYSKLFPDMKILIKKIKLTLPITIFLTGCAISNSKFFNSIELSTDPTYGFTSKNPVTIKNTDLVNSINSCYYYLSRLRTIHDNKLLLIQRYSVRNPFYKKPAIQFQNRYTGRPLNSGKGPLLDLYIMKPENEMDTIKIFINPYLKGPVKIPAGLKFDKEINKNNNQL
jgi:hypothetical protein